MTGPALRDILLPDSPGIWPPAPGWWLLGALVLLLFFAIGRNLLARWKRRRHRLRLRAEVDAALAAAASPLERLIALSALLRRWCRMHEAGGAALAGEAWLEALDRGLDGAPFRSGPGRLLLLGPYMPQPPLEEIDALEALVRRRILAGDADA